jgi:hypothetical protein
MIDTHQTESARKQRASSGHATAHILSALYRELAAGRSAPWALRRAQQRWRAEGDSSPVSWAGLTAITNGSVRPWKMTSAPQDRAAG